MAFGGGEEREVGGQRLSPAQGLAAEGDLAEDDREPERLLGVVVGRRHARDLQEREEVGGASTRRRPCRSPTFWV